VACNLRCDHLIKTWIVGLGLHLQELAKEQPDRFDLHQCERKLTSLTPYEHLHRLLRLCTVHVKRNIRKCAVSEEVRNLMRSLMCMEHDNWEGTLKAIAEKGGKPGAGKSFVSICNFPLTCPYFGC
jgi:hypothetical protein